MKKREEIEEQEELNICGICNNQIWEDETYVVKKDKMFHVECYEEEFGRYDPDMFDESEDTDEFFQYDEDLVEEDYGVEENINYDEFGNPPEEFEDE